MIARRLATIRACLCRLRGDNRGLALIEFAFAVPVLFLLFVGGYQLSDAIAAQRKVTTATRTIADLASQYTSVTNSDINTILNASQQVLSPYSATLAMMTVSQVKIDAAGTATVDWSGGKNTPALQKGTGFVLPATIRQPNTSLIVAQISYAYTPVIASGLIGPIPMKDQIVMSPRLVDSIGGP